MNVYFELQRQIEGGEARTGRLHTPHGTVQTPAFMPVGTHGAVKAVTPDQLREAKAEMILGNAYHLSLQPGTEIVKKMGGLHRFMSWDRPILTDSGGYQVMSLAQMRKITHHGVEFRSHLDGSRRFLGPAEAMQIQQDLGADLIMALDICPAHPVSTRDLRDSVETTLRWGQICRDRHRRENQALLGIVQGGMDFDLRSECAERLFEIGFDAYAMGGVCVGETWEQSRACVAHVAPQLPKDRVRYLMGVGTPGELISAIQSGIDIFDCVVPTRNARNGLALTSEGKVRIRGAKYTLDEGPLDPDCSCTTCRDYSRSYLRHLARSGETLAGTLISIHNIAFLQNLMAQARAAIEAGTISELLAWCDRIYPREVENVSIEPR